MKNQTWMFVSLGAIAIAVFWYLTRIGEEGTGDDGVPGGTKYKGLAAEWY